MEAHPLPFVSSAQQRAALRSSGECAVRCGLRPGCAGHHCWLGPHHLLPEALLRRYTGASGGAGGLWKPYSGVWAGVPGLSQHGEDC